LTYTQHKMRDRHPVEVVVELPPSLARVIAATAATGLKAWLVDERGRPFREDSYSRWFRDSARAAGLPEHSTPHGLRKRAAADLADSGANAHEIGAVTGHTTLKEVERYTKAANRKRLAQQAMNKRRTANT
jgi:integrase